MDSWFVPFEDVGPSGVDAGQGGKYLILPPGYKDNVPAGYIVLPSNTYLTASQLRTIPKSFSKTDLEKTVAYIKRAKPRHDLRYTRVHVS
jgi:hypothetical protein